MSLELANPKDQDVVALAAAEGADTISPVLLVDDRPYHDRILSMDWGQQEIPISVRANLQGTLARHLEDAPTELYMVVNGVTVPALWGLVSDTEETERRLSTRLISATVGALLGGDNAVRLNQEVEYYGRTPAAIARDALRRLPYPAGTINVDPLEQPFLTFRGTEGFKPYEKAGDIIARLDEQTQYRFRDTYNGHRAESTKGIASRRQVHRTIQASDIPDWRRPPKTMKRYSHVVVYMEGRDRIPAWSVQAKVVYRGAVRPTIANTPLYIVLNDETDEGPEAGLQLARARARQLAQETHASDYQLPHFDALLQKGDVHRVESLEKDDGQLYQRAWTFEVQQFNHQYGSTNSQSGADVSSTDGAVYGAGSGISGSRVSITSRVSYIGTVDTEELVLVPAFVMPRRSTYLARPLYGRSTKGIWFHKDLPWATEIDKGLRLTLSPGLVEQIGKDVRIYL